MGYGKRYASDPRWINVKYPGTCRACGAIIERYEQAFYYPKGKTLYCGADACGVAESSAFDSAAFDEAMMTGEWS